MAARGRAEAAAHRHAWRRRRRWKPWTTVARTASERSGREMSALARADAARTVTASAGSCSSGGRGGAGEPSESRRARLMPAGAPRSWRRCRARGSARGATRTRAGGGERRREMKRKSRAGPAGGARRGTNAPAAPDSRALRPRGHFDQATRRSDRERAARTGRQQAAPVQRGPVGSQHRHGESRLKV